MVKVFSRDCNFTLIFFLQYRRSGDLDEPLRDFGIILKERRSPGGLNFTYQFRGERGLLRRSNRPHGRKDLPREAEVIMQ